MVAVGAGPCRKRNHYMTSLWCVHARAARVFGALPRSGCAAQCSNGNCLECTKCHGNIFSTVDTGGTARSYFETAWHGSVRSRVSLLFGTIKLKI